MYFLQQLINPYFLQPGMMQEFLIIESPVYSSSVTPKACHLPLERSGTHLGAREGLVKHGPLTRTLQRLHSSRRLCTPFFTGHFVDRRLCRCSTRKDMIFLPFTIHHSLLTFYNTSFITHIKQKSSTNAALYIYRAGGSRTHTVLLPTDFKSVASAIPPLPQISS